jgi:hypothetical protein
LGSIIGRWLLAGLSCTSFTIFLIWVLLTVGAFIPPFFVSTYWVFFSFEDSQGQKDCKAIFGDTDFLFARTACDIQAGTYIAAIILILLASLGPVVIGLWDYSRVVCLPRRRAWVDMYAPLLKVRLIYILPIVLTRVFCSIVRYTGPTTGASSSSRPIPSSARLLQPLALEEARFNHS